MIIDTEVMDIFLKQACIDARKMWDEGADFPAIISATAVRYKQHLGWFCPMWLARWGARGLVRSAARTWI